MHATRVQTVQHKVIRCDCSAITTSLLRHPARGTSAELPPTQRHIGRAATQPEAHRPSCHPARGTSAELPPTQRHIGRAATQPEAHRPSCHPARGTSAELPPSQRHIGRAATHPEAHRLSCHPARGTSAELPPSQRHIGRPIRHALASSQEEQSEEDHQSPRFEVCSVSSSLSCLSY